MVEKSHTAGQMAAQMGGQMGGPMGNLWSNLYQPLRGFGGKLADWFAPAADAAAGEGYYEINVELPGVAPEDVDVALHENVLTVKGEKRFTRTEEGRSYFFSERSYGAFERSFRLPSDADPEKITADFKDGVLTLLIAKAGPPSERSRRIEIRTG